MFGRLVALFGRDYLIAQVLNNVIIIKTKVISPYNLPFLDF